MKIEESNKLIAEFMGWKYIPDAIYENDLYEAGDKASDWEITDIFVLNPSEEFLKQKKFGIFADEDYYDNVPPYTDYKRSLNYDEDWDLLMSVVEKIEKINPEYVLDNFKKLDYNIGLYYLEVLTFLTLYNHFKK